MTLSYSLFITMSFIVAGILSSKHGYLAMLDRLYNRTLALSQHPKALWALFFISFIESSVFPIPPDVLLIPMMMAKREKAWLYAGMCTIGSVLGGIAGYGIGYFFFETIGQRIIEFYGVAAQFESFRQAYIDWGLWIVLGAGITPFPYKVITIASGLFELNLGLFIVTSIAGRAFRFYLEAILLWYFGASIRDFIEKRLALVVTIGFILLLLGFAALKFL